MKHFIKKTIFSLLGTENYLRLLQRGYFFAYDCGFLRFSKNYKYHYYVKKLIHQGDTVIDIGANLGYYSKLFSRWVGPAGKVYSVEPIALYNKIFKEATRKQKNITLYPYALGAEEKSIFLVTHAHSGYLNTGLPHVYDADKDGKMEEQGFRFEAQMKNPARLFSHLDRINYIKCDVEGFEYPIMLEMRELIEKFRPIIQIEIWDDNRDQLFPLFKSMGYIPNRLQNGKLTSQTEAVLHGQGDYIFLPENNR